MERSSSIKFSVVVLPFWCYSAQVVFTLIMKSHGQCGSIALVQYFAYIIFYQRFIGDQIVNFIDLCSVSNISVFILDQGLHGYYIHGRSPHGTTDVNIRDMIRNLARESNSMSGTRGLQANSLDQIFIMRISAAFRAQYDQLFQNYNVRERRSICVRILRFLLLVEQHCTATNEEKR